VCYVIRPRTKVEPWQKDKDDDNYDDDDDGNSNTVRSKSRCTLRLRYVDLVVSIEVAFEVCCCFTLFSIKRRLNCNTGKVCNCLIQFLLTVVHEKQIQHLYKCTATLLLLIIFKWFQSPLFLLVPLLLSHSKYAAADDNNNTLVVSDDRIVELRVLEAQLS
jgi:hypothetical protein